MTDWDLAELNVATLVEPLDSPRLADFVANLDRINALAEASDGFVWRLLGDGNDATSLRPLGDDVIVNLSTWRDVDALHTYVYRTAHAQFLARRKEWFTLMRDAYVVLWWVPAGTPTDDGRSDRAPRGPARQTGRQPDAFTLKRHFPPESVAQAS